MKSISRQLAKLTAVALTSLSTAHARPDTLSEYDENTTNTATVASFRTNHPSGYSGFVSDIDAAWNINEGGVIDEFSPSGLNLNFYGTPFITGYGFNGYYNPTTLTTTGQSITFDDGQYEWQLGQSNPTLIPAISFEYFLAITGGSIGKNIQMSTTTGASVTQLGFTLLQNAADDITATAVFSDGSSYNEVINTINDGITFFGAIAPVGEFIESFSVNNTSGDKIFIDDLAFSTVAIVPEVSSISLAFLGLTFAARRRR